MSAPPTAAPSRLRLPLGKGELWALTSALAYALTTIFSRVAVQGHDMNYLLGVTLRAAPTFLLALFMGWRIGRQRDVCDAFTRGGVPAPSPPRGDTLAGAGGRGEGRGTQIGDSTLTLTLSLPGRGRRGSPAVSLLHDGWLVAMLIGYGVLTFVVGNPLHFAALQTGGVLVTTPVTGTQVLWAGIIAALFLRQPFNLKMAAGMAITIGGIALLALAQSGGTPVSPLWWLAVPFALGAAFCWATSGVLVTAAMNRGVDQFRALAVATGAGLGILNLYLLLAGDVGVYLTTPWTIQGAALLAGVFNAVALISLTTALSLTSVASATTLNTLQIALAPLLAWLFLGEPLDLPMGLGIVIIAGGAVIVQRARSIGRG